MSNIVFMGTPQFAVPILKKLIKNIKLTVYLLSLQVNQIEVKSLRNHQFIYVQRNLI